MAEEWQELNDLVEEMEGADKSQQQAWEELEIVLDRRERLQQTMDEGKTEWKAAEVQASAGVDAGEASPLPPLDSMEQHEAMPVLHYQMAPMALGGSSQAENVAGEARFAALKQRSHHKQTGTQNKEARKTDGGSRLTSSLSALSLASLSRDESGESEAEALR